MAVCCTIRGDLDGHLRICARRAAGELAFDRLVIRNRLADPANHSTFLPTTR